MKNSKDKEKKLGKKRNNIKIGKKIYYKLF